LVTKIFRLYSFVIFEDEITSQNFIKSLNMLRV
jgi:hypothetical protein